ncbi:hypothetical protein ACWGOQ_0017485 [Aquimarina sp. M1]
MKVLIKDVINNINISGEEKRITCIVDVINILSNNIYSQIKIYNTIVSEYLLLIKPIGPEDWKIDHPVKLREVHKQCYATKAQCIAIIRELYEKGNIDDVPGFVDVPIQDFTLDEMLEFKKEEEMMLRGEDPFV